VAVSPRDDAPRLFDDPPVIPPDAGPGRRLHLTRLAWQMVAVEKSATLTEVLRSSAATCPGTPGSDGYGRAFEDLVVAGLAASSSELLGDVRSLLTEHRQPLDVTGLRVIDVASPKAMADLVLAFDHGDGTTDQVPVNIKTGAGGVSVISIVRMATHQDWRPTEAITPAGTVADDELLEMVAGRRRILPGRDYYTLHVDFERGRYIGHECHGFLTRLRRGSFSELALVRHQSRLSVLPQPTGGFIAHDLDINAALADALLPWSGMGSLRAMMYCSRARYLTPDDRRAFAAQLLDTPLGEVGRLIHRAVMPLEGTAA
jgi:hypothetical protein